jgi:hypothetical protein
MGNLLHVKAEDAQIPEQETNISILQTGGTEVISPAGNAPVRAIFNEKREQRNEGIPGMQPLITTTASANPTGVFTINEESLAIKSWEAAFAGELFLMIPTPRSAKRFTNIYRILKASVQKNELAEYEGTAELPGEFALTMTLLAILTGQPKFAVPLFKTLYTQAKKGKGLRDGLNQLVIEKTVPAELTDKLISLTSASGFPGTASNILKWLPLVSRFSFELGKLFIKEELEQV